MTSATCSAAATLALTTSQFAITSVFGTLPSVCQASERGLTEIRNEGEKDNDIRDGYNSTNKSHEKKHLSSDRNSSGRYSSSWKILKHK